MKAPSVGKDRMTGVVVVSALAVLVAVPLLLVFWWQPRPLAEQASPVPLVVPVGSATTTDRTPGYGTVFRSEGREVRWSAPQGAEGVVTEVGLTEGQIIATGSHVLTVGSSRLLAYESPAPFHRPLSLGAQGLDVRQLGELMVELGLMTGLSDQPDIFDSTLEAAVGVFNQMVGGSSEPLSFDPASAVWIGASSSTVGVVHIEAGDVGLSPGNPIFDTARIVESVGIGAASGHSNPATGSSEHETYVFLWNGERFELTSDGSQVADHELDRFAEALAEYEDANGVLTGGMGLDGTIELAQPRHVSTVPASALLAGSGSCVLAALSPDPNAPIEEFTPLAVTVLGGDLTRTYVAGELDDMSVLANPSQLGIIDRC